MATPAVNKQNESLIVAADVLVEQIVSTVYKWPRIRNSSPSASFTSQSIVTSDPAVRMSPRCLLDSPKPFSRYSSCQPRFNTTILTDAGH